MALDVHLKRMGNSTWEFRLVGKKGFNISFTEAQVPERRRSKIAVQEEVVYSSPSTESSDEESQPSQEVTSGLYDPVLDDTEVIYETIGPADSDQRSNQLEQPTEVLFEVKQFTDQPDLTRSLTSSPFLISTKPYRPFSTEPLEVPPVEDPIILNPNYHDVFVSHGIEEQPPETRFKLPISEQYDPQYDPNKVLVSNKIYVVQSDETKETKQGSLLEEKRTEKTLSLVDRTEYNEKILKDDQRDYEYVNKMKTEIDLDKIEATALSVVEESIQQAVTVAEDIKKEIDIELTETVHKESHTETVLKESTQTETKTNVIQKEESIIESKTESSMQEQKSNSQKQSLSVKEIKEVEKLINDLPEIIDMTTDEIIQQKESVNIEVNEVDETNKILEKKLKTALAESEYKHDEQVSFEKSIVNEENDKIISKSNLVKASESKITKSDEKASETKANGSKMTTSKLLAEQRAYTIGLQTIPHIKGSVQSSYHYNLLLKTFFVHLTDVMVALSRFILTEPVTIAPNKDVHAVVKGETESSIKAEKQNECKKTLQEENIVSKDIEKAKITEEDTQKDTKSISNSEKKVSKTAIVKDDKVMTSDKVKITSENNNQKNVSNYHHTEEIISDEMTRHELKVEEGELIRKRKLSGAKIAQIEGRKPADLTNRMDKVISEFQKKSGTNEVITKEEYIEDHRRSRSRSRVGEEVIHENLSLESTTQADSKKKSMEVSEVKSEKCLTESVINKHESHASENLKTNGNGKLTYVAIVEAHVYTNKDAIFEEQMRRMSESSKVESSSFERADYKSGVTSKSSEVKKMSVINDAKEESVEELLLAKKIESSTTSSLHKSSAELEKSVTNVALQKTIDLIEPLGHIETEKKVNVMQAHATIEAPVKLIAAQTLVTLEEEHKIIQKEQLFSEKSHTLIEKPVKVVAEKSEIITEDNIEVIEVPKVITKSPKQVIEAPVKVVAEVKEVFINEEKAVAIETPALNIVKPKSALDTTVKAVAEKTEVLVGDNIGSLEAISFKPVKQAKIVVNESVAAVVTEMAPLEPQDEVLKVSGISMKQSKAVIQEPVFHIPETEEINLEESKGEIEIPKVTTLKANVQVEVAKVAAQAKVVALEETEKEFQEKLNLAQKSAKILIEEPVIAQAEVQTVKVEDAKCEITDVTDSTKNLEEAVITEYSVELPKEHEKTFQEEHAELKVTKHQIIEVTPPVEVYEDFDFDMKKIAVGKELSQTINIHEQNEKLEATSSSTIQSAAYKKAHAQSEQHIQQTVQSAQSTKMESQESRYKSSESSVNVSHAALSQKDYQVHTQTVQEKRQHADLKLVESSRSKLKSDEQRKLTLRTDLTETKSINANGENDQSPSPTSVPPTPLVDEYVFKLEAILPKNRGTPPVPRDCSVTPPSEHEDLNIVKKKLVPQIVDTNIEQVIYDPPLPTPTSPEKKSPPKYVKPGLRGGSDRPEITKEEIMDIERKSSLLTSAIDETIRSIEEYKESVGIDVKQGVVEEQIKTEFSSEIETEETSEQNGEVIISNGYVEENEQELNGSEDERHETIIEETENHVGTDETEQSIEQTVVFNGRITNGTNGLSKSVDIEFNEDKQEDIVETVTINLSKIKRDSLQETNVSTTLESNEIKEDVILNGDKYDSNNTEIELNNSDQTDRHSEQTNYSKTEKTEEIQKEIEIKTDPLQGYRSVEFNPEAYKQRQKSEMYVSEQVTWEGKPIEVYKTDSGEIIGSQQGIIDGLEEPVVDPEIAKELGKPGMPEEKIAELISGEAEMLREAHVMGLARVLKSHMHRTLDDDSSVDFMKIKPSIESLKDSEVLKALNEEILRSREEKKKEERKWTTFLQKPVWKPKQKVVFCGNKEDALNYNFENLCLDDDTSINGDESYRVKIVKQPKPRIAPDYKPEDFDTGPLPWEQRAVIEEKEAVQAPPVEPEEPILIPEDVPEFVEAVDPLPESEVPDLEDTGIPLPPPALPEELPTFTLEEPQYQEAQEYITEETDKEEQPQEEAENLEEMDKNNLSEQLMANIESMVDPNATLEEQLAQMRAQLAALAQLPNVIQQTLELVTKQICQISQQKTMQTVQQISENQENYVDAVANFEETQTQQTAEESTNEIVQNEETPEEPQEIKPSLSEEEQTRINREEEERMIEEQKRLEQQKKELIEQMRIEQESRLVKQRSTPRVGKPRPMFGPPVPAERPVVLPGGRKWRKPEDAYNEQLINEALTAQAEVIKGKAIGVNFMKYEKPPVSLDHLQQSEVYKVVHNMDQAPLKKVEMLTPVIAEADYRERKIKSRFSPVSSVANRWPSRGCSPSPQSEICNSMQ